MNEISDYEMLADSCIDNLNRNIDSLIYEGFQPYGNPFGVYNGRDADSYVCQAMVRYKSKPKKYMTNNNKSDDIFLGDVKVIPLSEIKVPK